MISNYFTLAALATEWGALLAGTVIRDVYSPNKDELTIEFASDDGPQSVRTSVRSGLHFIYRADQTGRPRSNVTTLFEDALGGTVRSVQVSPSDRILALGLDDDRRIDVHLYGSRPNVFLIAHDGVGERILSSFKRSEQNEGLAPPPAKHLPENDWTDALADFTSETSLERLLARARPRMGKQLIREWMFRSGTDLATAEIPDSDGIEALHRALETLMSEVQTAPCYSYAADGLEIFSLAALTHLAAAPVETFDSVDAGVRIISRQRARRLRLDSEQRPLVKALERATDKARKRVDDLQRAATSESRADDYEHWAHLLMANPRAEASGDRLTVADILGDGAAIEIPIKESLTVIENAERYYDRARSLRTERTTVAKRLKEARSELADLEKLVEEAAGAEDVREIERFQKTNKSALRRFIGGKSKGAPAPAPFRRFEVSGGFEVWVGRNAKENDRLTFDHASPHDLWLHARGVGGSHVVLRVPGRKTIVGKSARVEAAAIAAWFSSARGSALVPVIITERKYVSKPKGSDPGAVRVHREEVLMVEPKLPD